MHLICTTAELDTLCHMLLSEQYITIDTEFMRESTYFSKLCLIQVGRHQTGQEPEGWLIDPLADGINLASFFALMTHQETLKVFHSGRQDLEIIWQLGNVIPQPLFDTQVAAMVCGYGDQVSYEQLARDFAKAKIDKSHRFTDWAQRPLSENQLTYALGDVTHLCHVYEGISHKLTSTDRAHWLEEEMAILSEPATYDIKSEDAWLKLSGKVHKAKELAILRELGTWRDREARTRDVPRGRVIKDEALVDIAMAAPRSVEALGKLRAIPTGFERSKTASDILACVEQALQIDPAQWPIPMRHKPKSQPSALVDLLKVLLKAISEQEGVASKIIATTDALEDLARDDHADIPALKGWRRTLFGDAALAIKRGELALTASQGRLIFFATESKHPKEQT